MRAQPSLWNLFPPEGATTGRAAQYGDLPLSEGGGDKTLFEVLIPEAGHLRGGPAQHNSQRIRWMHAVIQSYLKAAYQVRPQNICPFLGNGRNVPRGKKLLDLVP
jgi:hypothetical protein